MGKPSATSVDMAQTVLAQALVATGVPTAANAAQFMGDFNFAVQGTFVGTVQLVVSRDGGVTFVPYYLVLGTAVAMTAPGCIRITNTEPGLLWAMQCTAFTSGTINCTLAAGASRGNDARLT